MRGQVQEVGVELQLGVGVEVGLGTLWVQVKDMGLRLGQVLESEVWFGLGQVLESGV